MLRILHKNLLRELLLNAAGTMAAVLALIFLGALSLQIGKASFDDLPVRAILRSVALFVTHTLNLTLPLSVLVTCLFTYGRAAADGEFSAARTSGVHPWHFLSPAALLGAAVALLLAGLQDRVMPEAHYATKFVGDAIFTDVDRVLHGAEMRLKGGSFYAKWNARARDAEGRLVLEDLYLVRYRDGKPYEHVSAARALPSVDDDGGLELDLYDVRRIDGDRDGVEACGYLRIAVQLDEIASRRLLRRKPVQLSNSELWSAAGRDPQGEAGRRAWSELDYRLALALSAPLFALFGAPLGLRLRLANRAFVFLVGALVVLVGYWPLLATAKRLGDSGAAPSWIAMPLVNVALLVVALRLVRSACRS